jgi:ketosteroid isomerase-like protein
MSQSPKKPSPSRRPILFALPLLFLLSNCEGPPPSAAAQEGPEALVREWVAMWNSYDLDEVGRLFMDDDRLTYFSSEKEGVIRGMEALLKHHRGFGFQSGGDSRTSRLWVDGLTADLFGPTAVMTGIWYFQTDPTDSTTPQKGPVTFVCVSDGGRWSFVHMNFSSYPPPEEG